MSGNATSIARDTDQISCADAARLLDVPVPALAQWSRELAFPSDVGAPGEIAFPREQIEALRAALGAAHSVEGAIRAARERLGGAG